jgi:pyoverdine/dityrosine biosynthesis protein Dit1
LEQCENESIYGGYIDAITRDKRLGMAEHIFTLLIDPLIGNKENRKYLEKERFVSLISPLIKDQLRLSFVMPSFPFKDQCLFRVNAPPSHVDIGEVALLIRLHTLVLALYQVHPFGADWIVASDGRAYADILRAPMQEVEEYFRNLLVYRNLLNLQGTVSIVDLRDMTRRLVSRKAGENVFEYTVEEIKRVLRSKVTQEGSQENQIFRVLVRGMKKNTNLKDILNGLPWNDQWFVLCADSKGAIPQFLKEIWQTVDDIVVESALNYAAFNIAIRYHEVYQKVLPTSIRASIHAKPNQIAAPELGDVYPWNGVGVLYYKNGKSFVETWELSRLNRNFEVTPFRLRNEIAPFYYRIDKRRT